MRDLIVKSSCDLIALYEISVITKWQNCNQIRSFLFNYKNTRFYRISSHLHSQKKNCGPNHGILIFFRCFQFSVLPLSWNLIFNLYTKYNGHGIKKTSTDVNRIRFIKKKICCFKIVNHTIGFIEINVHKSFIRNQCFSCNLKKLILSSNLYKFPWKFQKCSVIYTCKHSIEQTYDRESVFGTYLK